MATFYILGSMMTHTLSLGTIDQPSEVSIPLMVARFTDLGMQVERSFDLQTARGAHVGCTCPHHGTEQCDCQIVVLLVYGQDASLVTLVAHGRDGRTRFALIDHAGDEVSTSLIKAIRSQFRVQGMVDREDLSPAD